MDNKINGAVSFQAKLITNVQGRNNILKPIAEEFERITARIPGELHLKRAPHNELPGYLVMEFGEAKHATKELHPYLSYRKITKTNVRTAAKKLMESMRALQVEDQFIKDFDSVDVRISKFKTFMKKLNQYNKRNTSYDIADSSNKKNNKYRTRHIEERLKKTKNDLINEAVKKLEKYRGKGFGLDSYIDSTEDVLLQKKVQTILKR